ncbi:hypothetical protein NV226_01685 [Mycoplasma iguanae]|uniref:Uncharacterized protein n=1 Tax=Mycoplasma iguanae TaxID=292461 RepID=A0ABY5R9I5_9MOLU|nr:hypothetical protein [Mycoplasma iguanae]UVD81427.1 hypothetical protein NV226_01685 [Mycoplasma iguanae]
MELKNFTKLDKVAKQEIAAAGFGLIFASIISALPVIVSAISSLAGSFRIMSSDSGEIKSKDGTVQKWDKSNTNETRSNVRSGASTVLPTYFIY